MSTREFSDPALMKELRVSMDLWESTFNSLPDFISVQDADSTLLKVNKAYADFLQTKTKSLLGKKCCELLHGIRLPMQNCPHCRTLATGLVESFEWIDSNRGKVFEITTSPRYGSDGSIMGTIHVIKDISERKKHDLMLMEQKEKADKANAELQRAIEHASKMAIKAQQAGVTKSQFLATMSHEIRTPLNGVVGMTELLLDTTLTRQQREYAETIKTSAGSLISIVNDVLDFSKIETGKMNLDDKQFEPRTLVVDCASMLSGKVSEKKLAFEYHIADDVPRLLRGDALHVKQVLLNLANNAVKFTQKGSVKISLSISQETDHDVVLRGEVADTGIGIAENSDHLLFGDFCQIDNSPVRKYGGAGLGLTISKRLVELMGGAIGYKSVLGLGSTFWFTVRLMKTQSGPKHSDDASAARLPFDASIIEKNPRFLVVDDNETNRIVACSILKSFHFSADTAANGKEAIEALSRTDYNCVLMDVQMPIMDGLETARIIRDPASTVKNHAVPIIALTASSLREDKDVCLQSGMNGFILKPMHTENLAQALASIFNRAETMAGKPDAQLEEAVFNGGPLLDTFDGDEKMYMALLKRLVADVHDYLLKIRSGIADNDLQRVAYGAHAMKGVCLNIQANEVVAAAVAIEKSAKSGGGSGLSALLGTIDSAVERLTASISLYLSRFTMNEKGART
jgi:PAS domain S-box-containing protein